MKNVLKVAVIGLFLIATQAQAQMFYGDEQYSTYGNMPEDLEDARNERELINRPGMNHYPERGPHTIPESEVYPYSDGQIPRNPVRMDQFYENRERMREVVRQTGIRDHDQDIIIEHVIQDGGQVTSDSLRESSISDQAWEQITDDARFQ